MTLPGRETCADCFTQWPWLPDNWAPTYPRYDARGNCPGPYLNAQGVPIGCGCFPREAYNEDESGVPMVAAPEES